MTTTSKTLEKDKVVDEPAADPAAEQQGKAMREATPAMTAAVEALLVTRRGPQRTPKPWLMAVLCWLGMHQVQGVYVAEGNCTQVAECGRCGSVHVGIKHQREWRYIRERSCEQVNSCRRCNAANGEKATTHEWGETYDIHGRWWQFAREAHRCLRCGEVEEWTVNDD